MSCKLSTKTSLVARPFITPPNTYIELSTNTAAWSLRLLGSNPCIVGAAQTLLWVSASSRGNLPLKTSSCFSNTEIIRSSSAFLSSSVFGPSESELVKLIRVLSMSISFCLRCVARVLASSSALISASSRFFNAFSCSNLRITSSSSFFTSSLRLSFSPDFFACSATETASRARSSAAARFACAVTAAIIAAFPLSVMRSHQSELSSSTVDTYSRIASSRAMSPKPFHASHCAFSISLAKTPQGFGPPSFAQLPLVACIYRAYISSRVSSDIPFADSGGLTVKTTQAWKRSG
mmetsp:Transcript_26751/g.87769  ORF Transcript_26751/g.87769 Transcript_26751/m.87769 type:complete len:292 (-) Transcript_26751:119-994(-)